MIDIRLIAHPNYLDEFPILHQGSPTRRSEKSRKSTTLGILASLVFECPV